MIIFIIFILAFFIMVFRDPLWGVLFYIASTILRFQDYIPSLSSLRIPLFIMICTLIIMLVKGKMRSKFDNKLKYLLLFVGLCCLSSIFSGQSFSKLFNFFLPKFFLSFMIYQVIDTEEQIKNFLVVFYLLLFYLAAMLFHSYYVGSNYFYYWIYERPYGRGFMEDPNELSLWMNSGFIFSIIFVMMFSKKIIHRCFFLGGGLLSGFGTVLCNSRSGMIGFILGTGLIYTISEKKHKIIVLILLAVMTAGILSHAGSRFWYRMDMIDGRDTSGKIEGSASERLNSWKNGIDLLFENPFFGVGALNIMNHNFRVTYDGLLEGRVLHSGVIEVMAENGILGSLLWYLMILLSIKDLLIYRFIKDVDGHHNMRMGSIIFLCCCAPLFVNSVFLSNQYNIFLFVLFGFSSAIKKYYLTIIHEL